MDCIDRIVSRSAKYAKQLPNLNKIITAIYNGDRDFPPYVFLPSKEWVRIFFLENFNTDEAPFKIPVDNVMQGITVLNWRYSQGVYIFEPEIRDVLLDTKLPDAFPMEVFKRLPEWCLYIPVEIQFFGEEIHGFYAYLDFIENEDYLVISIDGKDDFTVLPIKISNKPIVEALFDGRIQVELTEEEKYDMVLDLKPLLSLLLYICQDEPEINNVKIPNSKPSFNSPKKVKGGFRLFVPDSPKIWIIGKDTSRKIREAKHHHVGGKKSPHLRRAHWHGFYKGSKKENQQQFFYKFLPMIGINIED